MASPPTRNGTPRLSEVARRLVAPSGIVSTGWPAVRDACRQKLGVSFDPWQDGAGRLILAKREDGRLAATIGGVGLSVPRQVGKTYLIGGMAFGLAITRPGMLTIWSAHHARTHGETFRSMQDFAKRLKVRPYIDRVYTGSGDEEIRFLNGSRVLFGARERGFGRGIPGVDMIVSDEAQIMSEKALDAQLATMNTSRFGLAVYIGTPPRPEDPSEAFTRMRTEAWTGSLEDSVWIEIGADPEAKPDDRRQWARANPSFPHRTPVESMLRLRKKLTAESFLREGLGIWNEDLQTSVLPGWSKCLVDAEPPKPMAIGLSVSLDRKWGSVGAAGLLDDGRVVVGANDRRPGTDWLVEHVRDIQRRLGVEVLVDERGPAAALIPDLADAGVRLRKVSTSEYLDACTGMFDRVQQQVIAQMGHPELDKAIEGAAKRDVGDSGRWAWGRKASVGDVSMLEAVTLAAWHVWTHPAYDVLDSVL